MDLSVCAGAGANSGSCAVDWKSAWMSASCCATDACTEDDVDVCADACACADGDVCVDVCVDVCSCAFVGVVPSRCCWKCESQRRSPS
jgi:hypothetical protein